VPSVQPLGTGRAPERERELGVSGGDETDVPVRQQSTTPVARDKPVRAQRRPLPRGTQLPPVALYRELPSGRCGRPWRSPRRRALAGGEAAREAKAVASE